MIKLYFRDFPTLLSTLLILGFFIFFGIVTTKRTTIDNWPILVLATFFMGLLMSIMSGTKDKVGTMSALFPTNNMFFIGLSVLGVLAVIIGIITLILRKHDFYQFAFYALSSIILVKIIVVEIIRVVKIT